MSPIAPAAAYLQTIARVRSALVDTFDQVDPWFDKPAAVRSYKPSSGGWTIDEVLEHVTLTSHFLMIVIRNSARTALKRAAAGAAIAAGESDLDLLEPIGRRGAFTWSRPEHMIPTGTVPSGEVRERMREQRRECLEILEQLGGGEGALHRVRMSVNQSGKLDIYQWLYFLSQHARRHIDQMQENEAEWAAR